MTQNQNGHVNGHSNGVNGSSLSNGSLAFDSIESTIEAFSQGSFAIVLDDASRENEGDLIVAGESITTEQMAFMIRFTSGYVCVPVSSEKAAKFDIPPMVTDNRDPHRTAYTVTVDALAPGVTTGISAHDRAITVRTLASAKSTAESFRRPGHILPLKAKDGLVRERRGHTEAALELCRLAGKEPAAAICEMVVDGEETPGRAELSGGRMMRRDDCLAFGKKWGIKVCTIEDMAAYVEKKEGKLKGK